MDVPSWCRVGNKCVCIDNLSSLATHGEAAPEQGKVYTIRSVLRDMGLTWLRFHEVHNIPMPYKNGFMECDWDARHFKPLVSLEDDIKTHFRALLDQPMREVV